MKMWLGLGAAAMLAAAAPAMARESGWVKRQDTQPVLLPGIGYAETVRQFSWDDGAFSYRGGGVSLEDGKARFHYDRSYPYEYVPVEIEPELEREAPREAYCEVTPVRGERGQQATVRICRN